MTDSIATDQGTCLYPECTQPRAPRKSRHGQPPRYCVNPEHSAQTAYQANRRRAQVPVIGDTPAGPVLSSDVELTVDDSFGLNDSAFAQLGITPPRRDSFPQPRDETALVALPPPLLEAEDAPQRPFAQPWRTVAATASEQPAEANNTTLSDADAVLCNQLQTLAVALAREAQTGDRVRSRILLLERDLEDERRRGVALHEECALLRAELTRAHGAVQRALAPAA